MRHTVIAIVALLVLGLPTSLQGQQPGVFKPGEWARITLGDPSARPRQLVVKNTVVGHDSLEFQFGEGTRVVPLDSLVRVERWHSNSHVTGGVLWGGGVGLLLGVLVAASWCDYYGYGCGEAVTLFGALGTVGGVAIGALIGGVVGRLAGRGGWEAIPLEQLRVQPVASVDGRFGLAASLRF